MAARIAIAHDDLAAQRAIVEQLRAEPYTGARAVLPRIRRPRPLPLPPTGHLFASLPEQRRPPRPWEQPAAIEAAPAPAPWSLTAEETSVVEDFVATSWRDGPAAVAVRKHWDIWIAEGRIEIDDRVEAAGESGRIRVRETRLGWNAVLSFDVDRTSVGPGNTLRPDIDDEGRFLWATREAAIAYSAHKIWKMFSANDGSTGRKRKQQDKIASRIEAFFRTQGIDATRPPDRELKRVLITRGRERELRLAAEAEAKAAKAVPAVEPDDGTPGETRLGRHLFRIGAIEPPSPLALKRRRLKEERAAAARAAPIEDEEPVPAPAVEPAPGLALTMDMGRLSKAHWSDRTDPADRFEVACPPFHLHDEDLADPVDQFLGQVVGIEPARALLFRREDPDVLDSCKFGQRYVLLRFWDDKTGEVWSMPVEGEDDRAVFRAIETTVALYQGHRAS